MSGRFVLVLLIGCAGSQTPRDADCTKPLRHAGDVAACEGQVVTLIGPVSRTKQPRMLGVDVDVDYELTGGPILEAHGTLHRFVVEPSPPPPPGEEIATRGPGTYWSLIDGDTLAKARRQ